MVRCVVRTQMTSEGGRTSDGPPSWRSHEPGLEAGATTILVVMIMQTRAHFHLPAIGPARVVEESEALEEETHRRVAPTERRVPAVVLAGGVGTPHLQDRP